MTTMEVISATSKAIDDLSDICNDYENYAECSKCPLYTNNGTCVLRELLEVHNKLWEEL